MSKLILYDIPPPKYSELNKLVNFLPNTIKNSYYQYRFCCHQLNLELPLELWHEIIYSLCEIRPNQVPNNKILEWFDQYIHDPRQHQLNPVFMDTDYSGGIAVAMVYLTSNDINVSYKLDFIPFNNHIPQDLSNSRIASLRIPKLGELMVGIVKDDRIKSVRFELNGYSVLYDVNSLYEYTFDRVYSHAMEQISGTANSVTYGTDINALMNSQYENKQKITFWSADIMPFSLMSSPYGSIYVNVEITGYMDGIKLLYAHFDSETRNWMALHPVTYKNVSYKNGMIEVNGL